MHHSKSCNDLPSVKHGFPVAGNLLERFRMWLPVSYCTVGPSGISSYWTVSYTPSVSEPFLRLCVLLKYEDASRCRTVEKKLAQRCHLVHTMSMVLLGICYSTFLPAFQLPGIAYRHFSVVVPWYSRLRIYQSLIRACGCNGTQNGYTCEEISGTGNTILMQSFHIFTD